MRRAGFPGILNIQEQQQVYDDLGDAGYEGTLNDRMYKKFSDDGFSGTLEDKITKALENQYATGSKSGNINAWKAGGRALDWASGGSVQFVGVATATNAAATTTTTTIDLTSISGLAENDMILVMATTANQSTSAPTMSTAGYTASEFGDANDSIRSHTYTYYKFMGATPDTEAVINIISATNSACAAIAYAFRRVNQSTPISANSGTVTTLNTARPNPPALTLTSGNMAVWCGSAANSTGLTMVDPGWENWLQVAELGTGFEAVIAAGYTTVAGVVDPASPTLTGADNAAFASVGITLELVKA